MEPSNILLGLLPSSLSPSQPVEGHSMPHAGPLDEFASLSRETLETFKEVSNPPEHWQNQTDSQASAASRTAEALVSCSFTGQQNALLQGQRCSSKSRLRKGRVKCLYEPSSTLPEVSSNDRFPFLCIGSDPSWSLECLLLFSFFSSLCN